MREQASEIPAYCGRGCRICDRKLSGRAGRVFADGEEPASTRGCEYGTARESGCFTSCAAAYQPTAAETHRDPEARQGTRRTVHVMYPDSN